jgi:hypothetical protein
MFSLAVCEISRVQTAWVYLYNTISAKGGETTWVLPLPTPSQHRMQLLNELGHLARPVTGAGRSVSKLWSPYSREEGEKTVGRHSHESDQKIDRSQNLRLRRSSWCELVDVLL